MGRADDESVVHDRVENNLFSWAKDSLAGLVDDWVGLMQGLQIGGIGKSDLGPYSFPIAQSM